MTIQLQCDHCHKVHEVKRTSEIPAWVVSLGCNWCPACEDEADDYWQEYYKPDNEHGYFEPEPEPIPDNQLCFPFLFDELEIPKIKEQFA